MKEWHQRVLALGVLAVLFIPLLIEALHKKPSYPQSKGTAERQNVASDTKDTASQGKVGQAATPPPKVHGNGPQSGSQGANKEHGAQEGFFAKFLELKLTDCLLILFTGLLAVYTRRLYVATAALVQVDRPRLLIGELKVTGIKQQPELDGKVRLPVTYRLKNFGRSPASLTLTCMMLRLADDLEVTPQYKNAQASRHVVVPDGWWGSGKPYVSSATPEDIAAVLKGDKSIFIYGFAEYRGLGGINHKFRFCYRFLFEDGDGDESVAFSPAGPDSYWEDT